jgi:hypothetical protein
MEEWKQCSGTHHRRPMSRVVLQGVSVFITFLEMISFIDFFLGVLYYKY